MPRHDVVGIGGRMASDATELVPLDEEAVRRAAAVVRERGHGRHRGRVPVQLVQRHARTAGQGGPRRELGPDVVISLSHEAAKEWREYERTSSTLVESYTGPIVRYYLTDLEARLADGGLRVPPHVMESSGGVLPPSRSACGRRRRCCPDRSAGRSRARSCRA